MLCFDGIDTIAEIYLNGQYIGRADNMLIPHTYDAVLQNGENELVVHIIPAMIEARKYPVGVGTITHLTYNADSLHLLANVPDTLEDFALASQITQAEALKYFIESYRCTKWERTGIIWWNLVDGWPQFSDSVVDYYFTKKLAYHTVKTSQQAVRLMLRNEENRLVLMGANEHL